MRFNSLYHYLVLIPLLLSCNQQKPVSEPPDKGPDDSVKVINLFAQSRPFGDPHSFDMPIDQGLETLKVLEENDGSVQKDDLVLGLINEGQSYAIPIKYMSGFEVANLYLGSKNYLLTWCPIVGSARWFKGSDSLDVGGFDFGRGLMNNNLLIVDRKTNSVWNQLSCTAVSGDRKGEELVPLPSIQSTWEFWRQKYPETRLIINADTSNAVFPQFVMEIPIYSGWSPDEEYKPAKEHDLKSLGLGLAVEDEAVFFPVGQLFNKGSAVKYSFDGEEITVYADSEGLTAWAEDDQGAVIPGTMVYQWAWEQFYPESAIYENQSDG